MKKKFLVPIMALAMVVTAGVNSKMTNVQFTHADLAISDLFHINNASAEKTVTAIMWDSDHYTGGDNCGDVRDSDNDGDFWDDVFNSDYEQETEECWADTNTSGYVGGGYGGASGDGGVSHSSTSNHEGGQRQVCDGGNCEYCEETNCY